MLRSCFPSFLEVVEWQVTPVPGRSSASWRWISGCRSSNDFGRFFGVSLVILADFLSNGCWMVLERSHYNHFIKKNLFRTHQTRNSWACATKTSYNLPFTTPAIHPFKKPPMPQQRVFVKAIRVAFVLEWPALVWGSTTMTSLGKSPIGC